MDELVIVVFQYFDKTTETVSKVTGTGVSYQITLDRMLAPPSDAKTRHGQQPDDELLGAEVMVVDSFEATNKEVALDFELLPYCRARNHSIRRK